MHDNFRYQKSLNEAALPVLKGFADKMIAITNSNLSSGEVTRLICAVSFPFYSNLRTNDICRFTPKASGSASPKGEHRLTSPSGIDLS